MPDICVVDPKAQVGESEIGSKPFLDGLDSFLDRIHSAVDGNLGWLFTGVAAVFGVILAPVKWFVDLWGFIATWLTYGIEALFVPSEWISELAGNSLSPLVVSSLILIIILRLLALPLALRANTSAARMSVLSLHIRSIQAKHASTRSSPSGGARAVPQHRTTHSSRSLPPSPSAGPTCSARSRTPSR